MNFKALAKYLHSFQKKYGIPGCDLSVYHNHINVFRLKDGFNDNEGRRTSYKDLYFMHSAAKLIHCVAILHLSERGLIDLCKPVKHYVPNFAYDVSVATLVREYSTTQERERHTFNHANMSKLVESVIGMTLDDYVVKHIFKPLKMHNSYVRLNEENKSRISTQYIIDRKGRTVESDEQLEYLFTRNEGCIITTVGDYALFSECLCNRGKAGSGYRLLKAETVDYMMDELVYNETTMEGIFVTIGYNGGLVLIDRDKHITIVYAQHVDNCGIKQMEIYPKIRELTYKCLGVNLWSKGFNVFP